MNKSDFIELEEIGEEKFNSKLEEQAELKKQFDAQEKRKAIFNAICLLTANGYTVEKDN